MSLLKTLHDTDSGQPTRIKYDGDLVYAGFEIQTLAGSDDPTQRLAVLDCLGSYEIHHGDDTAFVDMDELQQAIALVRAVPYIDAVDVPFADSREVEADD